MNLKKSEKKGLVSILAETREQVTRITIKLGFLMTRQELEKLISDLDRATMAMSVKYLGDCVREIWMNFSEDDHN